MRRLIIFLILGMCLARGTAQDRLILRAGEKLDGRIVAIVPKAIIFRPADSSEAVRYPRSAVRRLLYGFNERTLQRMTFAISAGVVRLGTERQLRQIFAKEDFDIDEYSSW